MELTGAEEREQALTQATELLQRLHGEDVRLVQATERAIEAAGRFRAAMHEAVRVAFSPASSED